MKELKERDIWQTYYAKIHISGEGELPELVRQTLSAAINSAGAGVQNILIQLFEAMEIEEDEDGLRCVDLISPCQKRDLKRARENVAKKRRSPPADKGQKEAARHQYKNSYHLEEVIERGGINYLVFRVAEVFSWEATQGRQKGKKLKDIQIIDATLGMQQLIASWLRPELEGVPQPLKFGVCQQAAQQFLSYIGLLNYGGQPFVSFPALEERNPESRRKSWLEAIAAVSSRLSPIEIKNQDGKITDQDWLRFIRSPFPKSLPCNFIRSSDVVVYERTWVQKRRKKAKILKRLYASLPIFKDVTIDSGLGRLASNPKLFWWRDHLNEFTPLPAWNGRKISEKEEILLVPLEYDVESRTKISGRFKEALSGQNGRKVNWSLLVQKGSFKPNWFINFATSRSIKPVLRPNVLAIHFSIDSIICWCLVDAESKIVVSGRLSGNEILTKGLESKVRLEEIQGKLRWVGGRRFSADLKRRTYEVVAKIVDLAVKYNANLAIEKINWVDKRSGGSEANRRFSLWNYSQLNRIIKDKGLDKIVDGKPHPVLTIAEVSDYLLRYTCQNCGACRKAKQNQETAETWRVKGILHCRKCDFVGKVSDEFQTEIVAKEGAGRLRKLLK